MGGGETRDHSCCFASILLSILKVNSLRHSRQAEMIFSTPPLSVYCVCFLCPKVLHRLGVLWSICLNYSGRESLHFILLYFILLYFLLLYFILLYFFFCILIHFILLYLNCLDYHDKNIHIVAKHLVLHHAPSPQIHGRNSTHRGRVFFRFFCLSQARVTG